MVKINISIEGEDLHEVITELFSLGSEFVKTNHKEIKEIMRTLGDDALDLLLERKMLERGAELYKKINNEINWTYKRDKHE